MAARTAEEAMAMEGYGEQSRISFTPLLTYSIITH